MDQGSPGDAQRLDQWLWFARITKSRTLAQDLIARGKVRLNREKIAKTSTLAKVGDVVTIMLGPVVRTFEVAGIGTRRGPAPEAQRLYRDLTPRLPKEIVPASLAAPTGRPNKRDRRLISQLKKGHGSL